jgi:Xaa-Pro aminopeptidase
MAGRGRGMAAIGRVIRMRMDIPALQRALAEQDLDGWLLYDFHGQNPTAVTALDLAGHMLTRRWFYLVPRAGEPVALVHAIELRSFPVEIPGGRRSYTSWQSQRAALRELVDSVGPRRRIAMEYFPEGGIPYLSRVDAGTLELLRGLGAEVVSSAELVQHFLCRWDAAQVESHRRALAGCERAKDAAFARIGEALRKDETLFEVDVQRLILEAFRADDLETDHAPIVAVNGHAGDPHYEPSARTPTPIRRGDLVLVDLWARGRGPRDVYADITWVGCAGEPSPKLREIFEVTAAARDAGLAALERAPREGRTLRGFEVDRVVRDHIAARGYGDAFVHRTGHSIGTSVHGDGANLDDLETHDTRPLVPGLGFSIEPGIYLPDEGLGVRSEIDVFLAPDGPRVFGAIQRELVRIGAEA